MWGDPQRASSLEPSDDLSAVLFQIAGPAHIPTKDPRWQELFHGYNVWVHLEQSQPGTVVMEACTSMARHATTSSNLAALALHVSHMLRELLKATTITMTEDETTASTSGFTKRIALVGKARATAGALRLMRILVHSVMVNCASNEECSLEETFMYRSRDVDPRTTTAKTIRAGSELLSSLLAFVSHMGNDANSNDASEGDDALSLLTSVPELYDAMVQSLELLLVLLSSQLYQPLLSSTQQVELQQSDDHNFFLNLLMTEATTRLQNQQGKRQEKDSLLPNDNNINNNHSHAPLDWSPQSVLKACLTWLIQRPPAPARSVAHHHAELARAVVQAKGKSVGPDGMYESHLLVMASKNSTAENQQALDTSGNNGSALVGHPHHPHRAHMRPPSQLILDATKGVLVLSSTIILLPFRLMSLALGLWGYKLQHQSYDQVRMTQLRSSIGADRRTHDVLWLSESPVSDLGSSLFLLLTNNHRDAASTQNPFRSELAVLNDNRWEGASAAVSESFGSIPAEPDPLGNAVLLQDNGYGEETRVDGLFVKNDETELNNPLLAKSTTRLKHKPLRQLLTANFESLFEAFGNILHTEVGALVLYTVLQSSPIFAASVAVRSDLDTLVLPLLRTLYFSSTIGHYSQKDYSSAQGESSSSAPFRSQSQLYVILILLLLFSQDASFGSDAFRRVTVSNVVWYKERNLKEINLGSVLLLTLLRSITFNTNRLQDAFLLSNCCAVLMNLSPNIVHIHEYAAMRLASVTMSSMKRYSNLVAQSGGKVSRDEDISTSVGMYGEVSRTLLRLLRHCIGPKNIDKNLHLVYALVYHQTDFNNVVSKENCPYTEAEIGRIGVVISEAAKAIHEDGDARTAPKALDVLKRTMGHLKAAVARQQLSGSIDSTSSELARNGLEDAGDFTFTYEEEADPEIFFIPYIWEVIVCVVTASSVEWDKSHIQVFPLIEPEVMPEGNGTAAVEPADAAKGYSEDVSDVV